MIDHESQDFKDFFVGWSVVSVGKTEFYYWESKEGQKYDSTVEGGLTFILHKNGMFRKVILGYTELGEWIEHCEDLNTDT
jgi:hypothetical protein